MDYTAFFADVAKWIYEANDMAAQYGMGSVEFCVWVAVSSGSLTQKYQENELVIKQMQMLVDWLEEVSKGVTVNG